MKATWDAFVHHDIIQLTAKPLGSALPIKNQNSKPCYTNWPAELAVVFAISADLLLGRNTGILQHGELKSSPPELLKACTQAGLRCCTELCKERHVLFLNDCTQWRPSSSMTRPVRICWEFYCYGPDDTSEASLLLTHKALYILNTVDSMSLLGSFSGGIFGKISFA